MGKPNPDFLASATLRELLDARNWSRHQRPLGLRDAIQARVRPLAADVKAGKVSLAAVDFASLQAFNVLPARDQPLGFDAELRARPEARAIREAVHKEWEEHCRSRRALFNTGRAGPSRLQAHLDGLSPMEVKWLTAAEVQRRRAAFRVISGGRA